LKEREKNNRQKESSFNNSQYCFRRWFATCSKFLEFRRALFTSIWRHRLDDQPRWS